MLRMGMIGIVACSLTAACADRERGAERAERGGPALIEGKGDRINGAARPWIVRFRYEGELLCTGALVHPEWVLSMGHCKSQVYLGDEVLLGDAEDGQETSVLSSQRVELRGDRSYALFELADAVDLSSGTAQILPVASAELAERLIERDESAWQSGLFGYEGDTFIVLDSIYALLDRSGPSLWDVTSLHARPQGAAGFRALEGQLLTALDGAGREVLLGVQSSAPPQLGRQTCLATDWACSMTFHGAWHDIEVFQERLAERDASLTVIEDDGDGGGPEANLPPRGALAIAEVMIDPDSDINEDGRSDEGDEFVEIVNMSDQTVSLGGVSLHDTTGPRFIFPLNAELAPGARTVVFGAGEGDSQRNWFAADDGGLGLTNRGESLALWSSRGEAIDAIETGRAPVGVSLQRDLETGELRPHYATSTLAYSLGW